MHILQLFRNPLLTNIINGAVMEHRGQTSFCQIIFILVLSTDFFSGNTLLFLKKLFCMLLPSKLYGLGRTDFAPKLIIHFFLMSFGLFVTVFLGLVHDTDRYMAVAFFHMKQIGQIAPMYIATQFFFFLGKGQRSNLLLGKRGIKRQVDCQIICYGYSLIINVWEV